ncbi:MAG: hypothetical protein PHI15_08400, partial [Methanomicrobium sp.]|nr:hypothetical protein [Methanomicrobium sp.]
MDDFSNSMRTLSEDIIAGQKDRELRLRELKTQTCTIRENAKIFLQESRRLHDEMGRDLQKGLLHDKKDLVKHVKALRGDFKNKEKEVRADLSEARKIWKEMKNT